MPKSVKISFLVVSVVVVVGIFLGVNVYGVRAADDSPAGGAYKQINVYGEVLQDIQSDYVVTPDMNTVTNGALRGLLESLDADSSYLTLKDYVAYKADRGGKAQIGADISKRYGYATVVSVVPNGPADKANLDDGDIIESINGEDTRNLSLAMIKLMLEGAPGSAVEVSVIRPAKVAPDKITLKRAETEEPPVEETLLDGASILELKPMTLDREHVQQVEAKLKQMHKTGAKKILLDLRDVSGGTMPEAMRMANFFLDKGTIAKLEGQTVATQTFSATAKQAINTTAPLVVLVNRGTAGPAEVVAAALQENNRAKLVGERTFGEGSEQKTFDLPDGGALILSVAKYVEPNGKKIEDSAVTPGILVASNMFDLTANAHPMATKYGAAVKTAKPAAPPDDQFNKALSVLEAEKV